MDRRVGRDGLVGSLAGAGHLSGLMRQTGSAARVCVRSFFPAAHPAINNTANNMQQRTTVTSNRKTALNQQSTIRRPLMKARTARTKQETERARQNSVVAHHWCGFTDSPRVCAEDEQEEGEPKLLKQVDPVDVSPHCRPPDSERPANGLREDVLAPPTREATAAAALRLTLPTFFTAAAAAPDVRSELVIGSSCDADGDAWDLPREPRADTEKRCDTQESADLTNLVRTCGRWRESAQFAGLDPDHQRHQSNNQHL